MKVHKRKMAFMSAMVVFFCATGSIVFFGTLHAAESSGKSNPEIKHISVSQARELIKEGKDVFVLDVRTKGEYNEGHIKESNHIPLQEIEQNIHKIPKDKKVIVYCFSGGRSVKACKTLRDKGLKELYNVLGGFQQWLSEGYPVEQ